MHCYKELRSYEDTCTFCSMDNLSDELVSRMKSVQRQVLILSMCYAPGIQVGHERGEMEWGGKVFGVTAAQIGVEVAKAHCSRRTGGAVCLLSLWL